MGKEELAEQIGQLIKIAEILIPSFFVVISFAYVLMIQLVSFPIASEISSLCSEVEAAARVGVAEKPFMVLFNCSADLALRSFGAGKLFVRGRFEFIVRFAIAHVYSRTVVHFLLFPCKKPAGGRSCVHHGGGFHFSGFFPSSCQDIGYN